MPEKSGPTCVFDAHVRSAISGPINLHILAHISCYSSIKADRYLCLINGVSGNLVQSLFLNCFSHDERNVPHIVHSVRVKAALGFFDSIQAGKVCIASSRSAERSREGEECTRLQVVLVLRLRSLKGNFKRNGQCRGRIFALEKDRLAKMFDDFEKRLLGDRVNSVLFTCEGDFSFSAAIMHRLNAEKASHPCLTATTLENKITVHKGFARSAANIDMLKKNGVVIAFGFDALSIQKSLRIAGIQEKQFSRVVCNFPCIGHSTWNKHVAMRNWAGQRMSVATREPSADQWPRNTSRTFFPTKKLPGYECRRGAYMDFAFPCRNAVTFIITDPASARKKSILKECPQKKRATQDKSVFPCVISLKNTAELLKKDAGFEEAELKDKNEKPCKTASKMKDSAGKVKASITKATNKNVKGLHKRCSLQKATTLNKKDSDKAGDSVSGDSSHKKSLMCIVPLVSNAKTVRAQPAKSEAGSASTGSPHKIRSSNGSRKRPLMEELSDSKDGAAGFKPKVSKLGDSGVNSVGSKKQADN
eukprot:IDg8489t1